MEVDPISGGDDLKAVRYDKDGWHFVVLGLAQTRDSLLLANGAFQNFTPLIRHSDYLHARVPATELLWASDGHHHLFSATALIRGDE